MKKGGFKEERGGRLAIEKKKEINPIRSRCSGALRGKRKKPESWSGKTGS